MSRKKNILLDFLKGIGCIGVILIHIPFPGIIGIILKTLALFAVPIFFMISGYYAYNSDKDNNVTDRMLRKIKHILKITIYALLLYFIYGLAYSVKGHTVGSFFTYFTDWKHWIDMIVLGDYDIFYGRHLWFLPALLYTYLIYFFIIRVKLNNRIYFAIPVLFLAKIIVSAVTLPEGFSWHWNVFFMINALPWFLLGNYFAYNKNFLSKIRTSILIWSVFIGVFIEAIFQFVQLPIDLSYIGTIIFSTALFLLAVRYSSLSINKRIETLGSTYSLYIYIFHMIVYGVVNMVMKIIGQIDSLWYEWTKSIIVILLTILVSVCYHWLICKLTNHKK